VTIRASASDNVAVASLTLAINGTVVEAGDHGVLNYVWATTTATDGAYVLDFVTRDAAGNLGQKELHVTVHNNGSHPGAGGADTEAPKFSSILGVTEGATVSGTVDMKVKATDNVAVTGVTLGIDGTQAAQSASASLDYSWATQNASDGPHTLSLQATDAAGNWTIIYVHVTVDNSGNSGDGSGSGGGGNSGGDGGTGGNDGSGGLTPPSGPPPDPTDTQPPTNIVIIGIEDGQTVWSTVKFSALALDDRNIWWTEALVGSTRIALSQNSNSLEVTWDSHTVPDGPVTITIRAHDRGGNSGTAQLHLVVDNSVDHGPPVFTTVDMLKQWYGVQGVYPFKIGITEDHALDSIVVQLEGNQIYSTEVCPLAFNFNSQAYPDGTYLMSIIATDKAGNQAQASTYVTVDNGQPRYTLSGQLLAPNGTDPVAGVQVRAPRRIPSSAPDRGFPFSNGDYTVSYDYFSQTVTDATGHFTLNNVPAGMRQVDVVTPSALAGRGFHLAGPLTVTGDTQLTSAQGTLQPGPKAALCVVTGDDENLPSLLAKLGCGQTDASGALVLGSEKFTLVDGNDSLPNDTYLNLPDLLAPGSTLDQVDQLFICSGDHYESELASHPAWRQRLHDWLTQPRSGVHAPHLLYAGAAAYDFIEQCAPSTFDFNGDDQIDGTSSTPEALNAAEALSGADTFLEFDPTNCLPEWSGDLDGAGRFFPWVQELGFTLAGTEAAPPVTFADGTPYVLLGFTGDYRPLIVGSSFSSKYWAVMTSPYSINYRLSYNAFVTPAAASPEWSLQDRFLEYALFRFYQ
jgi:hypothetical protein